MGFLGDLSRRWSGRWGPEDFWAWFQGADGQKVMAAFTRNAQADATPSIKTLGDQLRRVNPGLVWGLVPRGADGSPGCLEVSADGIRELIPVVEALVAAAPEMADWHVVAFKQPGWGFELVTGNPDTPAISVDTVLCAWTEQPDGRYDIHVFLPTPAGFPESELTKLGFIVLDHTLGEYCVMTQIGKIKFDSTLVAPPALEPIREFAGRLLPWMAEARMQTTSQDA